MNGGSREAIKGCSNGGDDRAAPSSFFFFVLAIGI